MFGYITLLIIFFLTCVGAFYYMTYHNGGVKPAHWDDNESGT